MITDIINDSKAGRVTPARFRITQTIICRKETLLRRRMIIARFFDQLFVSLIRSCHTMAVAAGEVKSDLGEGSAAIFIELFDLLRVDAHQVGADIASKVLSIAHR